MTALFIDDSSRTLGAALNHTAALVREKVWEISLLRNLGECVLHVDDRGVLVAAICEVLQGVLQLDACALYLREGERKAWTCAGQAAPGGRSGDATAPRHSIGPDLSALLERCLSKGAVASATADGTVRLAVPVRRGGDEKSALVTGALVLIGEEVAGMLDTRREVLAIIGNETATLLTVAEMFSRQKAGKPKVNKPSGEVSPITSRFKKEPDVASGARRRKPTTKSAPKAESGTQAGK